MKYHFNFILIALLTIGLFTGVAFAEPVITEYYPPSPVSSYEGVSQTFSVNVTETVDVIWQIDGVNLTTNTSVTSASYTNSTTPVGSHTVKAIAENANGTDEATWTWNVDAIVAPVISDISETDIDTTSATINFAVDQDDAITQIAYSTSSDLSSPSLTTNETSGTTRDVLLSSLSEGTTYYYRIYAYNAVNDSIFSNSSIHNFTTITPTAPSISDISVTDIKGSSATIEFDVNQTNAPSRVAYSTSSDLSSLIWSDWDYSSTTSRSIELTNLNAATKYYYSVFAYNASNESVYTNTSIYDFTTLSSWGNRIWDEAENLANPYTWDARSFSGFFYDLDTGETSESMEITIDVSGREIEQGDLVYTAVPITTEFEYEDWGEYEVIGFMAQKFFAGYTTATDVDIIDEDLSLMSKGILAEVLIDTDDDESVYSGSSLILEEGYTLNIQEVDVNGERVMISLTKDGDEVDSDILSADETYVYEKDLGSVDDV
ncbi:S-layer protein domain-containing protein, partial [Methanohalophilus sp.]|uniref:S-layer protein domain-containing protein n=1 Tax=Methanohalophilus sp. TaxID=1966352 RepID=UPI0026110060